MEPVVDAGLAVGLLVPRVQALAEACRRCGWTAKSMIVVVPPNAAARVPVSKVSLAKVPPKGSCMWVWMSIPPGMTHLPVASMTASAADVEVLADQGDLFAVDEDVGLAVAPR